MTVIMLKGIPLHWRLEIHPRRRHVAIRVDDDRQITVLAPPGFDAHDIAALLERNADRVLKKLRTMKDVSPLQFKVDASFKLLGNPMRLACCSSSRWTGVRLTPDGLLMVGSRHEVLDEALIRSRLTHWYEQEAARVLPLRVDYFTEVVGNRPTALRIRSYQSRWGYCRADGLIALNWHIIQAPLAVVDYIVVHELTHLRYPHHQADFWQHVHKVLPGVNESRTWLRRNGRPLLW